RFFIDRIATRVWAGEDGRVNQTLGNYTDHQRQLGRRQESEKPAPATPVEPVAEQPKSDGQRGGRAAAAADARRQKSLLQVERDIARLEGRLNELSDSLTVAGIDGDHDAVARL